jgi:hypothetical protein
MGAPNSRGSAPLEKTVALSSALAVLGKGLAVVRMKRLDAAARRYRVAREESRGGTLQWLMRAQDSTPDDGVSYGYSLHSGWTVSYPETTGYILQTMLQYHDAFGGEVILERARRMARWEADIQMPSGAIPGNFGTDRPVPVAFNTGQVLLGWAEYLHRFPEDAHVKTAAVRAGRWLLECLGDKPWFEGGVSAKAEHGNLSYNSMVSWGLAELGTVLGDQTFSQAAHTSALHYASLVDKQRWLYRSGFSDADSKFPLTHTLGYSIQGFIETGRLTADAVLVQRGRELLDAARQVIDSATGFLPGRVRPGWAGGTPWACLTGSAQFACCFLRLSLMGQGHPADVELASKLVDYIVATQLPTSYGRPELAYAVRGSYPFSPRGYEPASMPNWAAKFLLDAHLLLHQRGRS